MDATEEDAGMDTVEKDLYQRTKALLEPGDIEVERRHRPHRLRRPGGHRDDGSLAGSGRRHRGARGHDPKDVYVYSGNNDPDFSSNQHQGKTIDGDEFVWECQQRCATAPSASSSTTRPAPTRRASWRTSRTRATTSQASRVDRSGESWSGRVRIDRQDQSAPEFAAGALIPSRDGPTIGHDRGSGPRRQGHSQRVPGRLPRHRAAVRPAAAGGSVRGST